MALTDSLVSYWKLDESSGNAADSVGSNTLTNNNTVTYEAGKINNAAHFNGSNQSLSITDASQSGLDITGALTIAGWINLDALPTGAYTFWSIASKWQSSGNQRSYNLAYYVDGDDSDKRKFFLTIVENGIADDSELFSTQQELSTGTWYHVAGVITPGSPATGNIYLNGSDVTSGFTDNTAASIHNGTAPFGLGALVGNSTNFLDGLIDEIGIWSRALSGSEISELYNGGTGLSYPFTGGGGAAQVHSNLSLLGVG